MSSSASHRAHESRRYMSENGYYTTPAPYGYSNSGHFSLNIVPHEAEVVKQIFDWKTEEHFSYELIVDKLNVKGIRTKNNHYWSTSSIEYILHNPVYMGKIRYGKMIYQGIHAPIISEEQFYKINTISKSGSSADM